VAWAPIDLVSEQEIGEHWTGTELEIAGLLIEHGNASDIGWQQVGRTLDALHFGSHRTRKCAREHCLASAGNIFKQHVSSTKQRHHHQFHNSALADDHLFDIGDQSRNLLHCFPLIYRVGSCHRYYALRIAMPQRPDGQCNGHVVADSNREHLSDASPIATTP
jgi:hypothetical protein